MRPLQTSVLGKKGQDCAHTLRKAFVSALSLSLAQTYKEERKPFVYAHSLIQPQIEIFVSHIHSLCQPHKTIKLSHAWFLFIVCLLNSFISCFSQFGAICLSILLCICFLSLPSTLCLLFLWARPSSTLSEGAFLLLYSCLHLSSPHVWDFSPSALLLQRVQTLTELRKAFSSLILAPSIRNANTCDCVTRRSPATSAGAYGKPPPSHTHPAPCLWAFTRCHYFIVSLHACDWAVQLTLCCSGQAFCSPAHRARGVLRRGVWVWDSPFPGQASLSAHLDPYTQLYPSHCLLLHSTTSQWAFVCSYSLFESVITCELRHNCRNYHLCLTVGHFYMGSFCFLRNIRKRKLTLDRMRFEGIVVLANENQLFNFHQPLCQVLKLKESIVGIVSVFKKMNYW